MIIKGTMTEILQRFKKQEPVRRFKAPVYDRKEYDGNSGDGEE